MFHVNLNHESTPEWHSTGKGEMAIPALLCHMQHLRTIWIPDRTPVLPRMSATQSSMVPQQVTELFVSLAYIPPRRDEAWDRTCKSFKALWFSNIQYKRRFNKDLL